MTARRADRTAVRRGSWLEELEGKLPWWLKLQSWAVRLSLKAIHRTAYGATLLATTWPGRGLTFVGAVAMLADASWGNDPAEVPTPGGLSGLLVALGLGGAWCYANRRDWEQHVCDAAHEVLPGHTAGRPAEVTFGRYGLGAWSRSWDWKAAVPERVTQEKVPEYEDHFRQRIRAVAGASWAFRWDLRAGYVIADLTRDVPAALPRAGFRALLEEHPDGGIVGRDAFPMGISVEGIEVWDVEAAPHVLATGETGKGKSVAQLGILCHALEHPRDWDVVACDPKRVELGYLVGYRNVRCVAKDLSEIVEAIKAAEAEMDRRFVRMEAAGPGINHVRKLDPNAKRLLVVVDELQQVTMPSGAKDPASKQADGLRLAARAALERIAALGRAAGVHLYLSTQRPDVALGILTGPLKHNLSGRLACGPMDQTASQMALDTPAATTLPKEPKGRAIWRGIEGERQVQVIYTTQHDLPPKPAATSLGKRG